MSKEMEHNYNIVKRSSTSIKNSPSLSKTHNQEQVTSVITGTKNTDRLCSEIANKNKSFLKKGV